jgi:hypothetical protein
VTFGRTGRAGRDRFLKRSDEVTVNLDELGWVDRIVGEFPGGGKLTGEIPSFRISSRST